MEAKFTILLIDDIRSNLLTVEAIIMEHFNVNVITASNGKEALELIHETPIDLILSDVQMPVMDGFEFARILKADQEFKEIPFLFITAMNFGDDSIQEGLELGAIDYIIKPINTGVFVAKLKVFINLYDAKAYLHKVNEELKLQIKKSQQQEAQLIQQSRLAQMGEMISMIAHQWRQPLSSISSKVSTMLIESELGVLDHTSISKRLDSVSDVAKQLSDTLDNFRNFFKPDNRQQPFLLSDAFSETVSIIEPLLVDIELERDFEEGLSIHSYKNEIMQVLLNILNNAVDAIRQTYTEKGKIAVSIFKVDDDNLCIKISDNAGGIPDAIIDKVFDPYFSTKSKNGTGLGLYMSKMIIEEHCKGRLSVFNEGEWACFQLDLPIRLADGEAVGLM